jgi:ribosomal protein S12 methylthiotransferase accessory factor
MLKIDKTIAVCGSGLIADAAATALQDFATIKRVTAELLPASGAWDGLVVASDCWDLGAHPAAHRACQARRVPWLPIHTRHKFLPEPMCPECGGLADDTRQDARITLLPRPKQAPTRYRLWSPAEHSEEIISTYVGAEAGLIHDVALTDESGLAVAEASVTLRVPGVRVPGGGRTWDYRTSAAVAVLEALERYGGSNPGGKRTVVRAALADLKEPALDPRRLGAHEDDVYDQMPHLYRPFTEESVCNWVWGYSMTAGIPVLVPESCGYFWTLNHPDRAFLADTTNGCALGSCLEEAILYGILEVAERDAFLLT